MLQAFAETLMSAEASATCGAAYNERNEERADSQRLHAGNATGLLTFTSPFLLDPIWCLRLAPGGSFTIRDPLAATGARSAHHA